MQYHLVHSVQAVFTDPTSYRYMDQKINRLVTHLSGASWYKLCPRQFLLFGFFSIFFKFFSKLCIYRCTECQYTGRLLVQALTRTALVDKITNLAANRSLKMWSLKKKRQNLFSSKVTSLQLKHHGLHNCCSHSSHKGNTECNWTAYIPCHGLKQWATCSFLYVKQNCISWSLDGSVCHKMK